MKKFLGLVVLSSVFILASLMMPAMAQNGPVESAAPIIGNKVIAKSSKPARDLPEANLPTTKEVNPPRDSGKSPNFSAPKGVVDPLAQSSFSDSFTLDLLSDPIVNVDGMGGSNPNDTNGDIGPNDYVQMINSAFQIFDRQGVPRGGPAQISTLWTSADATDTSECATQNAGDPVVLYDRQADRWLLSQFANTQFICVAISQTPDPTGAYYLYQFTVDRFPDYYKIGIWPDGYYVSANYNGPNVAMAAVFDRANMLNGNPAGSVEFSAPTLDDNFDVLIPSNMEGETPPPAGAPNYMYRQVDSDILGGGFDRLELWEFKVNWANPASSTFTGPINIATAPFNSDTCGYGFVQCIDQPGTAQQLDPIQIGTMYRFQYRNFGNKETMVGNFTVDASGTDGVGIRWFVLERSGANPWAIANEGTYAPQPAGALAFIHRWMGSVAMDRFGNMALGYTASSAQVVFPSARYTGRVAGDPLGLMPQPEIEIQAGTSSGGLNRWGDYYTMSVDPVDDCTFWYTGDYKSAAGPFLRQSRIASFRFKDCAADLEITKTASPDPATAGEQITYTINVSNNGPLDATEVVVVDSLPDGITYLADNVPGDQCDVAGQIITCAIGDIDVSNSSSFTITAMIESDALQLPEPGGPKTFDNLVEGSAAQADDVPGNDSYTLSTLVNELADLSVTKTCKPDRDAVVGEDAPFCEIVVSNSGPSMAREVTLVDAITANGVYTIDNIDTAQGSCLDVGGDVECDLGDIDAGDSVLVTVHVLTELAIDINDVATVATDTPESDYSNNDATGQIHFTVASADLLVTKQCEPSGLTAPTGSNAFCEIFVYNNGPSTAVDVQLDDQIASDGSYDVTAISTSAGTCSATGTDVDVDCDLGDIASGDTVSVVVTFTSSAEVDVDDIATATSVTDDPDPNNNTATGSVTFAGADVRVTKQCLPVEAAMAGSTASCEIFVYNNGPSPAQGVVLDDQIASNGNYDVTAISTSAGSCSATGSNVDVSCDLGDIAAGVTVSIVVEFTSIESVDINDIATATSTSVDSDPNNNTATGSVTFVAVADLSITKSDGPDPVAAGTNLTYTLTVTNAGLSVAESVVVSDQVPAGVLMLSATPSVGSCVMGVPGNAAQPTLCGMGNFAIGQQETIVIVVAVQPDATGLLHNDASISSNTLDNNNGNNQTTADTTVVVVTDLWVTKTDDQDPVFAGTNLKYVITVGNNGPSTATMVTLIDSLPAETSWVKTKVLGGAAACLQSGANPDEVTCTLADLGPGDTFVVVITVLVDPLVPDGTTINNLAEVFLDGVLDTSASEDTEVAASADLWIDKTGNFITENPSKTIRYTLTVHNDAGCSGDDPQVCGSGGPSDAQDVVVFDQLPSTNKKLRVSFVSEDCLYDYGSHTVTCTMQTPLAAGDSVFFEIEAQPKGRLRAITNTASVSSSTPDPDTGNNTDDMLIIVSGGGQK